jgi:hypothetical protein
VFAHVGRHMAQSGRGYPTPDASSAPHYPPIAAPHPTTRKSSAIGPKEDTMPKFLLLKH